MKPENHLEFFLGNRNGFSSPAKQDNIKICRPNNLQISGSQKSFEGGAFPEKAKRSSRSHFRGCVITWKIIVQMGLQTIYNKTNLAWGTYNHHGY